MCIRDSHSTLQYLDNIVSIIKELQEEIDFTFLVIADKNPELPLKDFQFVPWAAATEIQDLLRMDIGSMPLQADTWSEGKCGFKLIQYLSLAIPALASPVGVNKVIIQEGINGYPVSYTHLDVYKRQAERDDRSKSGPLA